MTTGATVFVVDDDEAMRESLRELLASVGLPNKTYTTAEAFLGDYDPKIPGCLLLDIRMPGMSGPELQGKLKEHAYEIPIIMISGHADVPTAVRIIQNGAMDCIEKPFRAQALLDAVKRAIAKDAELRRAGGRRDDLRARLAELTKREYEVLKLVVAGKSNKGMAAELELSHKTIEFHRKKIMEKMRAQNVADLVRITLIAESGDPPRGT